ncbi:hypothetical protein [Sporosarcina ureilytica]|uniref:Uncharacterized protein n=1 Tax=Sporosarcina ureilytica TaxID=298596 RepID=A0A1D8JIG7_9BACL|nr:hypothetical protein [Sporosarcina ureilytica]AOV08509.1 hypothetical protein BI350_13855 [Sporosarcina ureilytica]
MKLLFQEQIIEVEQNSTMEDIIEKVNVLLGNQFYFSHLVADGQEITEAPEEYLLRHLTDITELEIIAIGAKQFVNDLLLSAEEYVARAIPHLTDLTDAFYHNPSKENWMGLIELFEGVQWLASMITAVDQSIVRPTNWDAVMEPAIELQNELGTLEEALENTDTVLVADILQYEILPVFETFAEEIKIAIDTEGMRHDLN